MNYFIIETKELTEVKAGWKAIATTTILADNSFHALKKVSESHCDKQYNHQIILAIDAQHEEETIQQYLNSNR